MNSFKGFTFEKGEIIRSKKLIDRLFLEGKSFFVYPFKVLVLSENNSSEFPIQLLVTVPKRNFKRAVHRNKLKRSIKEAYRLRKRLIYPNFPQDKSISVALIYSSKTKLSFDEIDNSIKQIFNQILSNL